jgi:hypothetical protein
MLSKFAVEVTYLPELVVVVGLKNAVVVVWKDEGFHEFVYHPVCYG